MNWTDSLPLILKGTADQSESCFWPMYLFIMHPAFQFLQIAHLLNIHVVLGKTSIIMYVLIWKKIYNFIVKFSSKFNYFTIFGVYNKAVLPAKGFCIFVHLVMRWTQHSSAWQDRSPFLLHLTNGYKPFTCLRLNSEGNGSRCIISCLCRSAFSSYNSC